VTTRVLALFGASCRRLRWGLRGGFLCGRVSDAGFRRVVFALLTAGARDLRAGADIARAAI
jgi:hypothetical protein